MYRRFCIGDAVVIAAVCIAALALFFLHGPAGSVAAVTTDRGVERYPLSVSRTISVMSGGHELTLQISDGSVCVLAADCPDRTCVHTGAIRRTGQSIVCIPSRVVVRIESSEDSSDVDWILP